MLAACFQFCHLHIFPDIKGKLKTPRHTSIILRVSNNIGGGGINFQVKRATLLGAY